MEHRKVDNNFVDDRGFIRDILIEDELHGLGHISITKGASRGHHYHKLTVQWIYLLTGKLLYLYQVGDEDVVAIEVNPSELVRSDILEKHAIIALEDSEFIVISKGPRSGEGYETDTYRLDEPLKVCQS